MFVVLVGDLNSGFSVHGPFHSHDEAVSWGVNEADGGMWQEMEVQHPSDYNQADDDVHDVPLAELAEYLAAAEAARKKKREEQLPKEVMIDLSELPVEA